MADVPPPGVGFVTVIADVVGVVRSDVRMVACRVVLDTNTVVRDEPFHFAEEEALKFVPISVRVKPLLPAVVEVGEIAARTGAGLLIVNVWALEVPPPGVGFTTVIDDVAPTAMSLAKIVAVS